MNINPVNFKLILAIVIAIVGVIFSIVNFILGKYITAKLVNNDLKHMKANIEKLEESEKDQHSDLEKELQRLSSKLIRIQKKIIRRETICEINHPNTK